MFQVAAAMVARSGHGAAVPNLSRVVNSAHAWTKQQRNRYAVSSEIDQTIALTPAFVSTGASFRISTSPMSIKSSKSR